MSKFIHCAEKGIQKYSNTEEEFLTNDPINMNLVKSIYLYHYEPYSGYREYFAIGFTMLDAQDDYWYFLDEQTRDKYYEAIGSNYFHYLSLRS